jgi:hypothetical protein
LYVGHIGLALAIRAERDAPPLWLLAFAAEGPDWGDALLGALHLSAGVPPEYGPHGWLLVGAGAIVSAVVALAVSRRYGIDARRAAMLAALAYISHWVADCVTGHKATWPGGPSVGLDLYGHPIRDLLLEWLVIAFGWRQWRASLPLRRRRSDTGGALGVALLGALLALQAMANLFMKHVADTTWS